MERARKSEVNILAERAAPAIEIEAVTPVFMLNSRDRLREEIHGRRLLRSEKVHMARLLCVAVLIGLQSISLPGQSHVSQPAVNLGDTSFLDGPAGPGFVAEQIGDAAHDGTITDSAGNAVPGSSAVNSISSLMHVAWLSSKKLLGGWYGAEVVLSAPHVNAGTIGESRFHFRDRSSCRALKAHRDIVQAP